MLTLWAASRWLKAVSSSPTRLIAPPSWKVMQYEERPRYPARGSAHPTHRCAGSESSVMTILGQLLKGVVSVFRHG
jgi:hypothetical protein